MENIKLNISTTNTDKDIDLSYYLLAFVAIVILYCLYQHNKKSCLKINKKKIKRVRKQNYYHPVPEYIPEYIPAPHLTIPQKLGEISGMSVSTHSGRIVAAPFRNPFCY